MGIPEIGPKPNQASPNASLYHSKRQERRKTYVLGIERKGQPQAGYYKNAKRDSEQRVRRVLRKKKPKLAEKEKASIVGEHNTNGQRMFSKETERTRGNKDESRKIISTIGRLTETKL